MQGCLGYCRGSFTVVVVVVHVALRVGTLRPGPESLVIGTLDASADGDAQPRDAHRAQAVDVDAAKVTRVGVLGDDLQELVVALADRTAVVRGGEVVEAILVQLVEVGDGLR